MRFRSFALRTSVVKIVEGVRHVKLTLVTLKAKPWETVLPSLLELNGRSVANEGRVR